MSESGDFLVGADGLRSKVRERLGLGAADAPLFSGRVAFRATVAPQPRRRALGATKSTLRLGDSAHLVQYPLRDGSIVNLVAVIEAGWRGARPTIPGTARRTAPRSSAPSPTGRARRAR